MARGLSRVLFGAAVGAKTPNSGGTEQHRSTIALAGSLRPKKASVEAHQAAGDQSTSYNLLITSLKCVSVTDRPKTFVRPLTSLLLCCARTPRVAAFRERQQPELHLGSHIFHLGGLGTLLTWDTHLASTPACSWDGHTACLAQVGNHQAMKQEKKTKTAPQAHVCTLWVRPVRPAGGRAAGWAGQGISERYGGHVFFHELKTSLLLSLITHKRGPHPCKGGQKSKTQEFIVPGQHRSAEKSSYVHTVQQKRARCPCRRHGTLEV